MSIIIEKAMNKEGYNISFKEKGCKTGINYCETSNEITNYIAHVFNDLKVHDKNNCPICTEQAITKAEGEV